MNPIGVRSVYDEVKRFAEANTAAYYRAHRLDARITRNFNTCGARMRLDEGGVVSNFIVQALQGDSLTVYGDGSRTRRLCYVSDLLKGILLLTLAEPVADDANLPFVLGSVHGPFNMGNPVETRVIDLAKLVLRLTGSSSQIRYLPLPSDDPKVRCPDITRARRLLGWEPMIDIEAGMKETIAYFRSALRDSGNQPLISRMPPTTEVAQS